MKVRFFSNREVLIIPAISVLTHVSDFPQTWRIGFGFGFLFWRFNLLFSEV